ncbi:hypothetical protein T11_10330 [Trichinella zimbabwensis]|uniref:Uncharacterized protein n=1 Tax=Trichinella zimbabwensis TaxID=268475 RepID=A0A0V1G847_9BILA|nr:hypothetical protein T11_10330 [Trichinella zimbabwensis]
MGYRLGCFGVFVSSQTTPCLWNKWPLKLTPCLS